MKRLDEPLSLTKMHLMNAIICADIELISEDMDLILIGASTGGPQAIEKILVGLPASFSIPIIIVQHLPSGFVQRFVKRLNDSCQLSVSEAKEGDVVVGGNVYVSSGGMNLQLILKRRRMTVCYSERSKGEKFCPSVNLACLSAAKLKNKKILTMILTGIGDDGLEGAGVLRKLGNEVWAQTKSGCTVYGMPKMVAEKKIANKVLALEEMISELRSL